MRPIVVPCGNAVNESETKAIAHLKNQLQNIGGDDEWILLTNLAFSVTHQFQSDEIDIIAIGPPGVRVIEIKHWTTNWVDSHKHLVEHEIDKLTNKARKIGTTLRRIADNLPRVDGTILLTRQPSKVRKLAERPPVRGVSFHTLNQWQDAIGFDGSPVLSRDQIQSLGRELSPNSAVAIDGSLRRLAGYVNLELQTPRDERFHRVYKGSHPTRRDRVVLHLYDLSASDDSRAKVRAQREAETLRRLQLYPWAPRILDSWQDVPGYDGEMFFFTVVDPAAPSIEDRSVDKQWSPSSRVQFAREAIRALAEMHQAGSPDEPLVHRNITPRTILVRYDNSPILTGFDRTRIPSEISVASSSPPVTSYPQTVAPEVQEHGLAAADQRSDVYSLCSCLSGLFAEQSDLLSSRAVEVFAAGLAEDPGDRCSLADIEKSLSALLGDSVPLPPAPPARYWTEDQMVHFRDHSYRIVTRLGSGGIGTTFKVVEIEQSTGEELGTYVAKVAHEREAGQRVLKAYNLARSHLGRHEALSPIYEVARDWQENEFISLMGWIDGTPLSEFTGVFPLLAEEQNELSAEALSIRWLQQLCEALDVLHRNGLIHGDVSPRNMIVSGTTLVLTDYDFVTRIDKVSAASGTTNYCSPQREHKHPASPGDDLFALAASMFHVLFEKEPFRYAGELAKNRGLNWDGVDRTEYPIISDVLDKATHTDPDQRFASATDMLMALRHKTGSDGDAASNGVTDTDEGHVSKPATELTSTTCVDQIQLREQRVDWLKSLLQSYPGSRWGNRETRGLDTSFAADTYVPTLLEESLLQDIRNQRVQLVILCGNAGDGKTALLQHLAGELGLGTHKSSDRILEGRISNGPLIRMNLDGSAAWQGRSADEILDEFLGPFQDGPPSENLVHLLAVNDGRLMEWIEGVEEKLGKETKLTAELSELLQQGEPCRDSHIRFISLNQRSLVGGITADKNKIETTFLERLIDHLYGGERASEIWSPCRTCLAKDRCHVYQASHVFGPDTIDSAVPAAVRKRARERLFEALQAVHLRGETHITVRELRAALVYILFGIHFCDDYHSDIDDSLPYWDRAFAADSPARQGEVLREMVRFDPAMEAHPQIDRYLLSQPSVDGLRTVPHFDGLKLESARRRAYFEWTADDIEVVAADPESLGLARGQHLKLFRELPLHQDSELQWDITRRLCAGISRLEDLPPQALDRKDVVPLRITPRTPTETAFWIEKPLAHFRIEANLPPDTEGIDRLHRQVSLIYRYRDGHEEHLMLGAELFHLLLELADGYQLGDVSTDDTFANLSIFVQRLVREDERKLLAWNPMQDERVYKVDTIKQETPDGPRQRIVIVPMTMGAES